jgi:hypothetical protein
MVTHNFFKQERKATLKRLLDFIKANGYKSTCPECGSVLDNTRPRVLECPKCKPTRTWPCLPKTLLIGRFIFDDGGTKHTVNQYLNDLTDGGFIEYNSEKGTYEAL